MKHIYIPIFIAFSNIMLASGIQFTPNKGQVVDMNNQLRPDILYSAETNGMKVYLGRDKLSYVLLKQEDEGGVVAQQEEKRSDLGMSAELKSIKVNGHRVDLEFVGGNTNTIITEEQMVEGQSNFYYAHCLGGITGVKSFNKLVYHDVYPNIDVVCYGSISGFKYDIVIKPGGNPDDISLRYTGADEIKISDKGELQINTSIGELLEKMPRVYQKADGKIMDVQCKYKLDIDNNNTITFQLGTLNPKLETVIDPWITYYGGTGGEWSSGIATDPSSGNVITTGFTWSTNFPVSPGAFQITRVTTGSPLPYDAFVVSLNSSGARVFATYYGGDGEDRAYDIATDVSGNIAFTGFTNCTNFPLSTGAFQSGNAMGGWPNYDAFVVKLNASGVRVWASYYGGTGDDRAADVAMDQVGNIFISGSTSSTNLPMTGTYTGFQTTFAGLWDSFVVKFNSSGTTLLWASYLGGGDMESWARCATDKNNNVIISAATYSTNFPVTSGAFQPSNAGTVWSPDVYITKFDPNGTRIWSTYFGGNDIDVLYGLAIDGSDNIFISGLTRSLNFPVAGGAQMTYAGGVQDGFIAKFNSAGNRLWATYNGTVYEEAMTGDCATDSNGNVYFFCESETDPPNVPTMPAFSCGYQKTFGGVEDQYITKYDPNGTLICNTYLGGTLEDDQDAGEGGIACYAGNIYMTASTVGNYPVTPGAYQTNYKGQWDITIAKLCRLSCGDTAVIPINFSAGTTTVCPNSAINFTSVYNPCDMDGTTYTWSFPGGTPSTSTDQHPAGIIYSAGGAYDVKLVIETPCKKDSVIQLAYIRVGGPVLAVGPVTGATCSGGSTGSALVTPIGGSGVYSYSWSPSGGTNNLATGLSAGTYTVTMSSTMGCTSTATVTITEPPPLDPLIIASTNSCTNSNNGSAIVTAGGGTPGYSYTWGYSVGSSSVTGLAPGNYSVVVSDANGCTVTGSVSIGAFPNTPVTFMGGPTEGCEPLCVNFSNTTSGIISCVWNFGDPSSVLNNFSTQHNPVHCYSNGIYSVSLVVTDVNGCTSELNLPDYITVHSNPVAAFTANPNPTTLMDPKVQFTNTSLNAITWLWNFGDVLSSSSDEENPFFVYEDAGSYGVKLIVINEFGCKDTATDIVRIFAEHDVYVPNSFTPNEDGINDVFIPKLLGMDINYYEFYIYDRWGNLIFKATDPSIGWDGRANNGKKQAQIDTYVWKLRIRDLQQEKYIYEGHVNLIR